MAIDIVARGMASGSGKSAAAEYSADLTYALGSLVVHGGKLYKSIADINVPEEFTPAHWQETTLAANLQGSSSFMNDEARGLLIEILREAHFDTDVAWKISKLNAALIRRMRRWIYEFEDKLHPGGECDFPLTCVSPQYEAGKRGRCIHVKPNSNNYVPYKTGIAAANIPDFSEDFTIQFWTKRTDTEAYMFMNQKYENNLNTRALPECTVVDTSYNITFAKVWNGYVGTCIFFNSSGDMHVRIFSENYCMRAIISDHAGIAANVWAHIALTRKNGVIHFFVNGHELFRVALAEKILFTDQFAIGNGFSESSATGGIAAAKNCNTYVDSLEINDRQCYYDADFVPEV